MLHTAWNLGLLHSHSVAASLSQESEAVFFFTAATSSLFTLLAVEGSLASQESLASGWLGALSLDAGTVASQASYAWPIQFALGTLIDEDVAWTSATAYLGRSLQGELWTQGLSTLVADWYRGGALGQTTLRLPVLSELVFSLDPWLLALELLCVLLFVLCLAQLKAAFWLWQPFYDDLVLFCKARNVSVTEAFTLLTLSLGYIVFDAVIAVAEEDILENTGYALLACMLSAVLLIVVAVDVQYFALVSGASNGELSLRLIYSDLLNNVLCLMRVFSCWIRYLFYDLQAEAVDLVFHYSDIGDPHVSMSFEASLNTSLGVSQGLVWNSLFQVLLLVLALTLDVIFWIIQILVGCLKLALALYLFWLVLDLLLLRSLVHAESLGLTKKHTWRRLAL